MSGASPRADPDGVGVIYETVLVTDRGFLAGRVIRGCQRQGARVVALVGPGDEAAPHAQAADETVPFAAVESDALAAAWLEAAEVAGAQAIHPGAGLPVQAGELAAAIRAAGLDWLGPDQEPAAGRLSDGAQGATLVAGAVVDGWRWLVHRRGRPAMAESVGLGGSAVGLVEGAVDAAWPVASVALSADGSRVIAVRRALAGVDRLVEARTGIDLVARQLGVVEPVTAPRGHAMSVAVFAADAEPAGTVRGWQHTTVDGVLLDTALADGRHYDSWPGDPLILLTAAGSVRSEALRRLTAALDGLDVRTPALDLAGVRALLRHPAVVG